MNDWSLQAAAGFLSTTIFIISSFPMLIKALKTRDMRSYSLLNIGLANIGNLVYWIYILNLPSGPVWLLHGFNTLTTLLMLTWRLKYANR